MDVAPQTIDDFKSLVNKMRGSSKLTKADATKTTPDTTQGDPASPDPVAEITISNSQQSFDKKIEHFGKMTIALEKESLYTPNEAGFSVSELNAKLAKLSALNDAANTSSANLKAARIERNTFFYKEGTGLLTLVKQAKAYIKSLYGQTSQQYKSVTAIPFFRVISSNKAN